MESSWPDIAFGVCPAVFGIACACARPCPAHGSCRSSPSEAYRRLWSGARERRLHRGVLKSRAFPRTGSETSLSSGSRLHEGRDLGRGGRSMERSGLVTRDRHREVDVQRAVAALVAAACEPDHGVGMPSRARSVQLRLYPVVAACAFFVVRSATSSWCPIAVRCVPVFFSASGGPSVSAGRCPAARSPWSRRGRCWLEHRPGISRMWRGLSPAVLRPALFIVLRVFPGCSLPACPLVGISSSALLSGFRSALLAGLSRLGTSLVGIPLGFASPSLAFGSACLHLPPPRSSSPVRRLGCSSPLPVSGISGASSSPLRRSGCL